MSISSSSVSSAPTTRRSSLSSSAASSGNNTPASRPSTPIQPGAYTSRDRIPDDVYALINRAPKNEIHVHQGGSSSVEFLSYCLRAAVAENQKIYEREQFIKNLHVQSNWFTRPVIRQVEENLLPKAKVLDEFPVFHADGPPEMVRFTEADGKPLPDAELREAIEKAFTLDNMRTYHRYQLESDNQKSYKDTSDIAETTATHAPKSDMISATESAELKKHKDEGLQAYRNTSRKINPFVKNNWAAYKLANEYAKSMAFENIRYTEYRVSPSGNGIGGANGGEVEGVLSAVHAGFAQAQQHLAQRNYPLDYGLIVLFERQDNPAIGPNTKVKQAVALANKVVELKRAGKYNICGVDLAGDEAKNPVTEFKPAFDIIQKYNAEVKNDPKKRLGITIHAGETPTSGPLKGYESIEQAIKIAHDTNTPMRIGHGLQIVDSPSKNNLLQKAFELYQQFPNDWEKRIDKAQLIADTPILANVIKNGIVLEMCPKSNLQTYGIHPGFPKETFADVRRDQYSEKSYRNHPAVFLSRLGVKVAISSDNRTISNTDVTNEFVKLFKYAGLTYADFKKMVLNGFEGAFIGDPQKKAAIIQDAERQFENLKNDPINKHAVELMGASPAKAASANPVSELSPWGKFKAGVSLQWQGMTQALHLFWHKFINFFTAPFKRSKSAA